MLPGARSALVHARPSRAGQRADIALVFYFDGASAQLDGRVERAKLAESVTRLASKVSDVADLVDCLQVPSARPPSARAHRRACLTECPAPCALRAAATRCDSNGCL
jgi:hypothetical protein